MPLTPEQIKELKHQLSEQIKHLPEEQKKEAQKQIDARSPGALESMLKQQMAKQKSGQASQQEVFRSIISGDIPSKKLDENSAALAVLDIKPISKGHTVIIPKKQVTSPKNLPTSAFTLAKKIAKKITSKLHSTDVQIQTESKFGEIIINVIPIYDQPLTINSPRQDVKEEDLQALYNKLKKVEKPKVIRLKKPKSTGIKLKIFRIP